MSDTPGAGHRRGSSEERIARLERELRETARACALRRALLSEFNAAFDAAAHGAVLARLHAELRSAAAFLGRIEEAGIMTGIHAGRHGEQRYPAAEWPAAWQRAFTRGAVSFEDDMGMQGAPAARALLAPLMSGTQPAGILAFWEGEKPLGPQDAALLDEIRPDIAAAFQGRLRRQQIEYRKLVLVEDAYRLSEAKLRAIFDESMDMIATIDGDGRIIDLNKAGAVLLGYGPGDKVVGRNMAEFWANAQDSGAFNRRLEAQGFIKDFEVLLKRHDGSTMFGLASATQLRNRDGTVMESHAIIKDITERIRDEQALWKMNVELADANKKLKESQTLMVQQEKLASIGQLAAGVAHEINNPLGYLKSNNAAVRKHLAAVKSFLEQVMAGADDAIRASAETYDIAYILGDFDAIMQESEDGFRRITEIVQNLKSFSRIDSAERFGLFDINKGIENTLAVATNEVKYVADVKVDLGPLPPVECIGGEINQVFLNLIVNAAQAIKAQSREGRGTIVIRTGAVADKVWIEVSDDGPGIPEEIQLRIFDPFFTTKPVGQGTGLGLSISSDIIANKHGGRLTVSSEPGKGASFRISLPVTHPRTAGPVS